MNKKGAIGTVAGIAILMIFVAVILISLFCPECLAPAIAKGSEKVGNSILSGLKDEKFEKGVLDANPDVLQAYTNIVNILRDDGAGIGEGPCILKHETFPEDFNDFRIRVLFQSGGGILTTLVEKKGSGERQIKSNKIPYGGGRVPCIVGEGGGAENFYDNFLDDTRCNPADCSGNYNPASIEFKDNDHIWVAGNERDFREKNLMFKAEDGNICFIPTEQDGTSHNKGHCAKKDEGIDDDCVYEIEDNIVSCERKAKYPFAQDLVDEEYTKEFTDSVFEFYDSIKKAMDSDKSVCRVEFRNYPEKDKQRIKLTDNDFNLRITAEHKDGDKNTVVIDNIGEYSPCIVKGRNFWKWLWEGDIAAKADIHFDLNRITIVNDDKMKVNPDPIKGDTRDKDLFKDKPLIIKTDSGHICLIPTFNDKFNSNCGIDGDVDDGEWRNHVDNDCLRGTKIDRGNRIPKC